MDLCEKKKKKTIGGASFDFLVLKHISIRIFGVLFFFALFLSLIVPNVFAAPALMSLIPSSGSFSVGKTFQVTVQINTTGTAINAAEGIINYDPEKLSVESISRSGSIFSLWTTEPSVTGIGIIEFGGGIPSPGYTGSAGNLFTITFKSKSANDTNVSFVSGAVLANDGKGTNILSTLRGGNYSISAQSVVPQQTTRTPSVPVSLGDSGPQIISTTHPDQESWYNLSTATFKWDISAGVTGVRLLIGKIARVIPTVSYIPPINTRTIEDLGDGVWYFHAQFRDNGGWGDNSRFKINIDTVKPQSFILSIDNEKDPTNPTPLLVFKTADKTSGIDRYEITLNSNEPLIIEPEKVTSRGYQIEALLPGTHTIVVAAYDRAGNFTEASASVTVKPIRSPVITNYPERLTQGSQLIIEGVSLIDSKVIVGVQKKGEGVNIGAVQTDGEGRWKYTHVQSLDRGTYSVYAIAEDSRGAQSLESPSVTVEVSPPLFLEFGKITIDYLTTMVTLIILIVAGVLAVAYGWFKIVSWRRRLRKEVGEAQDSVTNSFRALSDEMQEQFDMLHEAKKRRELTKEEKRILERMKENIKVAEHFIKKEIKDIAKEIE